jgi:hypothetical protein
MASLFNNAYDKGKYTGATQKLSSTELLTKEAMRKEIYYNKYEHT